MKDTVENIELEKIREKVEIDIKSYAENNETKLRLHLWTSEEYREDALSLCSIQACCGYLRSNPGTFMRGTLGESWQMTLSRKMYALYREASELKSVSFSMRTPSLSCLEIPDFVNNIVENSKAAHNYICLDNDIYKHINTHCKDLLKNGTIQVFVDGKLHDCNTDIAYIKR